MSTNLPNENILLLLAEFLWQGRAPRLCKPYLERPKCLGGLALPNLQYYYWATNLRVMHYWLQAADSEHTADRLSIEAASRKPSSLPALLS